MRTKARLSGCGVDDVDVTEPDDLLRDEAPRLLSYAADELVAPLGGERRAEDHAVAARLGDVLDHELVDPVEHDAQVLLEDGQVGGCVLEDGLLPEIVADHLGDEVVDALVVRDAVAGGVDDGDVSGSVRGEDSRHADERVGVEGEGIEVLVREAPIDHAHAMARAGIVAQEDLVVDDLEVLGEGEGGADLLGKERVLEKGRVVAAGGEDHGDSARRDEVHDLAEQARVVAVVADAIAPEQAWVGVALDVANEERVTRSRGNAQVVLEHPPASVLPLDEVLAGHVRIDAGGRRHAVHLGEIALRGVDELFRDHAVVHDALVRVDVAQEGVERAHALLEPGL